MLFLAMVWIVQAGPNQPVISLYAGVVAAGLGRRVLRHRVRHPELPRLRGGCPAGRREQQPQALADHLDHGLDHRHRPVLLCPGLCHGGRLGGFTDPEQFADDFSGATNPYFTLGQNSLGYRRRAAGAVRDRQQLVRLFGRGPERRRRACTTRWVARVSSPGGWTTSTPRRRRRIGRSSSRRASRWSSRCCAASCSGRSPGTGCSGCCSPIALMIVYIMTNVSCFALYFYKYRDEFKCGRIWSIPILGTIAMLAPLAAALIPDIIFGPENANVYPVTLGLPITIDLVCDRRLGFYRGCAPSDREQLESWPTRWRPSSWWARSSTLGRARRTRRRRHTRPVERIGLSHKRVVDNLEDRDRVDRGTGAARQAEWSYDAQKRIAPLRRAHGGDVFEVEAVHEVQPHRVDPQAVDRIADALYTVGDNVAVAVEAGRGDPTRVEQLHGVRLEAGLGYRGVPRAELQTTSIVSGANQRDIAFLELDTLGPFGVPQLLRGDGVTRFEPVHAPQARDVEQDAPPGDASRRDGDRPARTARSGDGVRGDAVVQLVAIDTVVQRVDVAVRVAVAFDAQKVAVE